MRIACVDRSGQVRLVSSDTASLSFEVDPQRGAGVAEMSDRALAKMDAQMTIRRRECPIPGHASYRPAEFDATKRA